MPSRAMRIALSPQWLGFHLSTGGSLSASASRAMSARLRLLKSSMARAVLVRWHCAKRAANRVGMEFEGPRTAIVTGGARRIGAEIVRALAADGWHLLIHYHDSQEEAEALAAEIGNA